MRVNYEVQDLSDSEIEWIIQKLNAARIPYLLEHKQILINKDDEDSVDDIVSNLGNEESTTQPTNLSFKPQKIAKWKAALERDHPEILHPYLLPSKPIKRKKTRDNEDAGVIAWAGLILGGGFGVYLVIAAMLDPTYEGRIYLFLPAFIFGGIGFGIGLAIETGLRKSKG
jgi:hypothetical protein